MTVLFFLKEVQRENRPKQPKIFSKGWSPPQMRMTIHDVFYLLFTFTTLKKEFFVSVNASKYIFSVVTSIKTTTFSLIELTCDQKIVLEYYLLF